jgi:hypothetical protein
MMKVEDDVLIFWEKKKRHRFKLCVYQMNVLNDPKLYV